jgi:hypothetical protein
LSTADVTALTDARINLVKAALQLTPDQEKYWPAIEEAIRARAKDRQARLQNVEARVTELRSKSPVEALRDRNPVDFLHRRAEVLAQRAADLKKLADAWQPLYPTLSQEQKRRMAALTIFVFREMRDGLDNVVCNPRTTTKGKCHRLADNSTSRAEDRTAKFRSAIILARKGASPLGFVFSCISMIAGSLPRDDLLAPSADRGPGFRTTLNCGGGGSVLTPDVCW